MLRIVNRPYISQRSLLYAVASDDLHPFHTLYTLNTFYKITGYISPFTQHIIIYTLQYRLCHEFAGPLSFFQEILFSLFYHSINKSAKTDNCNSYDHAKNL